MAYHPVIKELQALIKKHRWEKPFQKAVTLAHDSGVVEMADIKTTEDYLDFLNDLLRWVTLRKCAG